MLNFITVMQAIGCVLVIFGHSYPFATQVPEYLLNLRAFIYTFHMPLFVFCSGYLLRFTNQVDKYTFYQFTVKRAKRILIPYFVFSIIGIIPKALLNRYLNDDFALNWNLIWRSFLIPRENIWGHFWFLPMIFFLGIIGYLLDSLSRKFSQPNITWLAAVIIGFGLSFLSLSFGMWLGINDVLLYFWFFALGAFFSTVKFEALKDKLVIGYLLCILSVVILLPNVNAGYVSSNLLSKTIGLMMVAGIMLVCVALNKRFVVSEPSMLRQTYTIFILSWPCQLLSEVILERVLNLPLYITMPAQFTIGIVGSFILIKLMDCFEAKTKTRFLSFCLGK